MDYRHWQAITYLEAKVNQSAGRAAELLKLSPLFYLLTLYICANGVVTVLTFLWCLEHISNANTARRRP